MVGSDLILPPGPSTTVFSLFGWGPSSDSSPTLRFCLRTPLGTREHESLFFRQASHACDFPEDGTWNIGRQLGIRSDPRMGLTSHVTPRAVQRSHEDRSTSFPFSGAPTFFGTPFGPDPEAPSSAFRFASKATSSLCCLRASAWARLFSSSRAFAAAIRRSSAALASAARRTSAALASATRRSSAAFASAIRRSSAARRSAFAILSAFAFFNTTSMRAIVSSSDDIFFFGGEDGLQHYATALIYVENLNSDNAYFSSASHDCVTCSYQTSAIISSDIRPYDLGGSAVEGRYC